MEVIISASWNSMSRSQKPCKIVVCLVLENRDWCPVTESLLPAKAFIRVGSPPETNPETRIHVAVITQQPSKGVMAAGTRYLKTDKQSWQLHRM